MLVVYRPRGPKERLYFCEIKLIFRSPGLSLPPTRFGCAFSEVYHRPLFFLLSSLDSLVHLSGAREGPLFRCLGPFRYFDPRSPGSFFGLRAYPFPDMLSSVWAEMLPAER